MNRWNRRCEALEHLHSAWVDGELGGREQAQLAAHLQRCAKCRTAITELRVTQSLLRSMPVRDLVVALDRDRPPVPRGHRIPVDAVRRAVVRSGLAAVMLTATLTAAAFAAGSPPDEDRQVAVPVDVFVADHLVRAVGGPVSTPALLDPRP